MSDKHVGLVVVNDNYIGLGLGKENDSRNPTPPVKASFLPNINKKVII